MKNKRIVLFKIIILLVFFFCNGIITYSILNNAKFINNTELSSGSKNNNDNNLITFEEFFDDVQITQNVGLNILIESIIKVHFPQNCNFTSRFSNQVWQPPKIC